MTHYQTSARNRRRLQTTMFRVVIVLLSTTTLVTSNVLPSKKSEPPAPPSNDDQDSLYDSNDQVYVLNVTNFKSSVHDSGRAWLVEFYNSYCGFCRKFAPMWKSFGKSVHGWRDIVAIGAVNCANDDNNDLCRDYEIMGYPTLKFFHYRSINDKLGIALKKGDSESFLRERLIDQLIKDEQDQEAGPNWPNLVPYRNSEIKTLWEKIPMNVTYQFLIFEEPNAYLGSEVILDLHKLENIRIRRLTTSNSVLLLAFAITKFPTVVVIERNDKSEHLKTNILTREEIVKVIKEFLQSKGISTEIHEDEVNLIRFDDASKNNDKTKEQRLIGDKLYQLDLETAVRYSLNNEIRRTFNISGEKMTALKIYLEILSKYFPSRLPNTQTYFKVMQETLEPRSNISGKEFNELVKLHEKELSPVYSAPKAYIGCKGSAPIYRGYPCGLWTLFHTLTVAAAEEEVKSNKDDAPSVLAAMHGYIKNFFGCTECSQHFQEMSTKRKLFDSRSKDDDIIWLWQAHNEVNQRLAGEKTEDPEYKKIQYPSAEHCPKCRLSDGKWNEHEVLLYLKIKYSKASIDLLGINDKEFVDEMNTNTTWRSNSKKFGWDFTIFDFSICVVLYVVSAALLILVCLKFAYKRTYKKKMSFQNLFGLV